MKTKFFIIFVVGVVLLVGGLGVLLNKEKPSKFDGLAQSLKEKGAEFYGAFWCPHCQEQKAEFGSAKKYLPYIECSTPNNSQVKICEDNKIESYPSWKFKDGVTINSKNEPIVCDIKSDSTISGANDICNQISSKYFKAWFFPDYQFSIKSPTDPVKENDLWKFSGDSIIAGKLPMAFLAEQIGYTIPE